MSKKKFAVIAGAILILYSLIGFVVVPLILEYVLPGKLSEALDRPVSIENIRLNPFALTASVEGLHIKDKNAADPFVSFDKLFVNIQTMSLFKLGLVAKEVRLEKPDIRLIRTSETEFNFSDLIAGTKPEPEQKTAPPTADEKPFQFSISNIAIIDGMVSFQDDVIQKAHTVSAINFTLPQISNFDQHVDSYATPLLTGDFNQAGISIDVDTKPFTDSLETIVRLSLSGLSVPYYFAYVPENMVGFEITNGRLDVDARVSFLQETGKDKPQVTVEGTINLAELQLLDNTQKSVLTLPDLKIDVAPSRPLAQQLTLASVTIQSPELSVSRNSEGIINLATLGPKPSETGDDAQAPPAESAPDAAAETGQDESTPDNPFILTINEFLLDSGKILFTDAAVATDPVEMTLDNLVIKISDFTNAPDKTAACDIRVLINSAAALAVTGQVGVTPLSVDADFSLADLQLAWGQPYLPDNIQLVVTDGKFETSGHAAVRTTPDGELHTTVTGTAAVNEFNSVTSAGNEAFVSWNEFSFDGIDVSVNPLKINTDKILLKDFKNQVIVFDDGATNLARIFVQAEPEAAEKQKPIEPDTPEDPDAGPAIPIKIGEVLLDNFDFTFIDKSIDPQFSTRLNLSELKVTGLTSEDFKAADLTAEGKLDEYAPIKIKGSLNPLKEDLFLDITYSLSNMELSPLSPYTGKYIGRAIEKGKLSTDVVYKIDKKVISAKNRVLLDQFTLGQTVDSPDALNLPVGVAIALLKDRKGQINVNLPISGRTDDPNFGIGKPLLKALENLIVKAATSPFDLVSSIVGGGEELRYIEFAAAATAIDAKTAEKLDAIKKLMYERPALKLDIAGYADMDADKQSLTDLRLARKIKSRSLKKDSPKEVAALDAMELNPEEYQTLLKQVYAEELPSDQEKKKTLKPVNDPTLTVEEMESQLSREITVTDADLRLLAQERAQRVKDYLLTDDRVTADRIFLTEPNRLTPEKKGGFQSSRVELNVR